MSRRPTGKLLLGRDTSVDLAGTCALLLSLGLTSPAPDAAHATAPAAVASFSLGDVGSAPEPVLGVAAPAATGAELISPLALASGSITAPREPRKPKKEKTKSAEEPGSNEGLGPERARVLLQSMTIPGWGQASLGHYGSAKLFALIEVGVWSSFIAFRVQEALRTDSYLRTARLSAGIDLSHQDDEMRRIVGAYASSEEYNLLVVTRDAANLYLSDVDNPDLAGYRDYIARHSISGDLAWQWTDEDAFLRYGGQRKNAQRAGLRSNAALGVAVANRLVSALHAARRTSRPKPNATQQGWRLELEPGLVEPGRFRAALTTSF